MVPYGLLLSLYEFRRFHKVYRIVPNGLLLPWYKCRLFKKGYRKVPYGLLLPWYPCRRVQTLLTGPFWPTASIAWMSKVLTRSWKGTAWYDVKDLQRLSKGTLWPTISRYVCRRYVKAYSPIGINKVVKNRTINARTKHTRLLHSAPHVKRDNVWPLANEHVPDSKRNEPVGKKCTRAQNSWYLTTREKHRSGTCESRDEEPLHHTQRNRARGTLPSWGFGKRHKGSQDDVEKSRWNEMIIAMDESGDVERAALRLLS